MSSDFSGAHWEQNPDALLVIAPDGTVLHWNPAAEATFGYTEAEARGRSLAQLVVLPDQVRDEEAICAQALQSGVAVHEPAAAPRARLRSLPWTPSRWSRSHPGSSCACRRPATRPTPRCC